VRSFGAFVLLVAAFALGAWIGWWAVPAVAAFWGWLRPAVPRPMLSAALGAAFAWGLWLEADSIRGHGALERLTSELSSVMHLPAPALYLVTLLFAGLLGWSAAALGCAARGGVPSRSGEAR
jgi:hypothetical protein